MVGSTLWMITFADCAHKRIAGRVGAGYVALFSADNAKTVAWATPQNTNYSGGGGGHHGPSNYGREIIASTDGSGRGAWACVVGDEATHGSFANFTRTVLEPARFSYTDDDKMVATLRWPGGDELTLGWEGAMTVVTAAGREEDVPMASQLRYDNPYVQAGGVPFPLRGNVTFVFGSQALELDFDRGIRRTVPL